MTTMAKAYKGMGMEGSIARWYDKTTRKDLPAVRELAAKIAALMPAGGAVLEVAPGPGFLSIELAKRGLHVQAVDISKTMVELARKNAAAERAAVTFMHGNAAELPVRKESVDFVVCRAAFKNFTEPVKAMREMLRVLRPGGTALLIDMRRDTTMDEARKYVNGLGLGWFQRNLTTLSFRPLIKRAYPLDDIRAMAKKAGWPDVRIDEQPLGFAAWVTK
jgi:ubiquinone/menaquinone biosynthesis C-methylase UbiE